MSPYVAGMRARIGDDLLLLPTIAVAVFDDHGRVLMAEHVEGGRWSVIGGGVEPDEDPADAARREVAEEVGLAVELRGIVGVYGGPDCRNHYANGHQVAFVAALYAASLVGEVPGTTDGEISATGWFDEPGVAALDTPDWTRRAVRDAFGWWRTHGTAGEQPSFDRA